MQHVVGPVDEQQVSEAADVPHENAEQNRHRVSHSESQGMGSRGPKGPVDERPIIPMIACVRLWDQGKANTSNRNPSRRPRTPGDGPPGRRGRINLRQPHQWVCCAKEPREALDRAQVFSSRDVRRCREFPAVVREKDPGESRAAKIPHYTASETSSPKSPRYVRPPRDLSTFGCVLVPPVGAVVYTVICRAMLIKM